MKILATFLLAAAVSSGFCADLSQRELKRARVIHCVAEGVIAPVIISIMPVEMQDGTLVEPAVLVEGDEPILPETSCTFFDSYADGVSAQGDLLLWRDGENPIEQMLYTAIVSDGRETFSVADFADTTPKTGSGAFYDLRSHLLFLETGAPFRYEVSFLRNEAMEQWVDLPDEYVLTEQEGDGIYSDGFVRDNPDPATIFSLQRELDGAVMIFELDYRE